MLYLPRGPFPAMVPLLWLICRSRSNCRELVTLGTSSGGLKPLMVASMFYLGLLLLFLLGLFLLPLCLPVLCYGLLPLELFLHLLKCPLLHCLLFVVRRRYQGWQGLGPFVVSLWLRSPLSLLLGGLLLPLTFLVQVLLQVWPSWMVFLKGLLSYLGILLEVILLFVRGLQSNLFSLTFLICLGFQFIHFQGWQGELEGYG